MAEKKVYHVQRQFIDPDHTVGSTLHTYVVRHPGMEYKHKGKVVPAQPRLEAGANLGDCSRQIHWSFEGREPEELVSLLQKAETVLEQWTNFTCTLRLAVSDLLDPSE